MDFIHSQKHEPLHFCHWVTDIGPHISATDIKSTVYFGSDLGAMTYAQLKTLCSYSL